MQIMTALNPQFITDTAGSKLVVLSAKEFDLLMEEIEELEDIRLYDEAKKKDSDELIPMNEAFQMIESKR